MHQSNVICIHLGEYRSRVFTGDLPEGFLQLDDNTSQHNTSPNPPGNVQQHQAMYQSNVPMQVVTRIKVTVAQVWQSYEGGRGGNMLFLSGTTWLHGRENFLSTFG